MSATLAQSITWDSKTDEQKRLAVTIPLCNGQHYEFKARWGSVVLKCVNEHTLQFRVVKQTTNDINYPDLTGWLIDLPSEDASTLKPCSKPVSTQPLEAA